MYIYRVSLTQKRRKKKLATILCPIIIMLVESRVICICNNCRPPPRPLLSFGRLLMHTWNYFWNSGHKTNSLIIPNIVGAHWNCYSSWTVKSGEIYEVRAFFQGADSGEAAVTGSLNHWPCIFGPLLCRIRIYGVYGQPLLQWSTTESQGSIQKFPCTICTSRSTQRKNIHFDFGKTNMI